MVQRADNGALVRLVEALKRYHYRLHPLFRPISRRVPTLVVALVICGVNPTFGKAETLLGKLQRWSNEQSEAKICVGCFPPVEALRVDLRWDTSREDGTPPIWTDLDLHVWRPSGQSGSLRRDLFWDDNGSAEGAAFGTWRCDDRGGQPGTYPRCESRGEKFNVPSTAYEAALPDHSLVYCFAVQRWASNDPSPVVPWELFIRHQSGPALHCAGNSFAASADRNSDTLALRKDFEFCRAVFQMKSSVPDIAAQTRLWSGLVALKLPASDAPLSVSDAQHTRDVECDLGGVRIE
jgi:hypothetical protein